MDKNQIQKYRSKSIPNLIQIATRHFNAFIRKRDTLAGYFICISCKKAKGLSQMHAGHFYAGGNHSNVRFDENNVHGQCIKCNTFLHGNLIPYAENLKQKIGEADFETLKLKVEAAKQFGFKWDRIFLIETIEKYKEKSKRFE